MNPEIIVTIGVNYPDGIEIKSIEDRLGLWCGRISLKNTITNISTFLTETEAKFENGAEAEKYLNDFGVWCVKYVNDNEVHEID